MLDWSKLPWDHDPKCNSMTILQPYNFRSEFGHLDDLGSCDLDCNPNKNDYCKYIGYLFMKRILSCRLWLVKVLLHKWHDMIGGKKVKISVKNC